MKRSSTIHKSDEPRKRRRQAQTSCDSCRKKKLKCDRGNPCFSCLMRGLPCTGQPSPLNGVSQPASAPAPTATPAADESILGRLRRLEQAVFGAEAAAVGGASTYRDSAAVGQELDSLRHQHGYRQDDNPITTSRQPPSQRAKLDNERQQTAKFLDSTFTRQGLNISLPHDKVEYKITSIAHFPKTPSTPTLGLTPSEEASPRSPTWLMTREEALGLLEDFTNSLLHMLPIVHGPTTRSMIDAVYDGLSRGEQPNPAHAALILGIGATSAFFFSEDPEASNTFPSSGEATQTALAWSKSALDILHHSHQVAHGSLEEAQSRAIVAYLVYNLEGCSGRFRFLHSCSLAAAREGCVHLVDSPHAEQQDDPITKEIKRRLWWHIVATDWMLGLMGGPTDGTYSANPKQMNVKCPRNIGDDDASLSDETVDHPRDTPTPLSCFLRRIELAEITRSIIDARASGNPDVETTDYEQVLQLDQLFENSLSKFPPFLQPNGPIPQGAPRHLSLQRDVVLLGFHSRRARLHRPFLLHDTENASYQHSRDVCLRSARTVLSIAVRLLRNPQARDSIHKYNARAMGRRLGCVIGHTFMACTILALNAALGAVRGPSEPGENGSGAAIDSTAETHAEVADACRALASAGEESAVAARLVRNLASVLRRYRVHGVDDVGMVPDAGCAPEASAPTALDLGQDSDTSHSAGAVDCADFDLDDENVLEDDLGLDGLWDGILGDASTAYGWDQLFAGLDPYCGPT